MTPSSDVYLAIEGIDGTGKTYVARHIAEKFDFSMIQEPSSGLIGSLIISNNWDPVTDFFLFMADRATMLREADIRGKYVSDRSLYSSFAYQGYYLKNSFEDFDGYFDFFMRAARLLPRLPTHVFLLYSDIEVALSRVSKRGEKSRFEREDYLRGVQELYFNLKGHIENLFFIDSNVDLDSLYAEVDRKVTELLQPVHPL